jgi:glycosyltransferase involved in cell wall biosynthesis
MRSVAAEVPGAIGLIVGEGQELDRLLAQREALGLQQSLHLSGYWPSVAEALAALDVFVLPSLMEGHPLAILEAMAASLPVVATRVGGNAEAVEDGVTGLLVPAADPRALADAVVALLRDPERRRAMGQAARQRFEERFSLARAVGANEEIYAECWKRHIGGADD